MYGGFFLGDKHFRPLSRPGHSRRRPFSAWVEYKPNSIWIYDTTHFTKAKMAVLIIQDLVSPQVDHRGRLLRGNLHPGRGRFTDVLQAEGLLELVERRQDGRVDLDADDENRSILFAVSDNGPQMTSGSTREFMALCAIAQHFGRPGTPTDQAWVESFNGHLKVEFPHLFAIEDPAPEPRTSTAPEPPNALFPLHLKQVDKARWPAAKRARYLHAQVPVGGRVRLATTTQPRRGSRVSGRPGGPVAVR